MGCGASNTTNTTPQQTAPSTNIRSIAGQVSRPLTRSKVYRHGSPITQLELNRQRDEFWGTRVSGNNLMWQAIHSAADALIENDLGLASAILEASNITTPNGSLEVCYDELGNQYKIPIFCLVNPIELTYQTSSGSSIPPTARTIPNGTNLERLSTNASNKINLQKVPNPMPVKIRIRVNPGDHNLVIDASNEYSIQELKKMISDQSCQPNNPSLPTLDEERQRIMFLGRELKNTQTLAEVGFDDSKVIQVFMRPVAK